MTLASSSADGAPSDDTRPVRPAAHIAWAIAGQGAALAALALVGLPAAPPAVKAPVQAAVSAMRPAAAESLAGPALSVAERIDSKQLVRDLLTKAGLRPTLDVRRLSWAQARRVNALMPAATATDTARPFRVSVDTKEGRQALHCLTQAAYFEAGANGPEAQAAVVQVVLNRVRHPDFPKSVCGVVYQGAERATGCQFTFTCDGALKRALDVAAWNEARKVAQRALQGYVFKPVGASTYYHADYVFPTWAPTLVKTCTIGPHIFYRMTGQEGSAAYLTGHYAGGELKLSKAILRAAKGGEGKADKAPAEEPVLRQAAVKGLRLQAGRSERVHALLAAEQAQSDDAQLNLAQTEKADPAPAAAPAEPAPTPVAQAPAAPAA